MSHRDKLEQVLDYIINEEADAASDLLHQIVVEKARDIYEELVEADELEDELDESSEEDEGEGEELDEAEEFGGDMKDDFADEIRQGEDEIDSDEMDDMSDAEGIEGVEGEEEVEDRVEDLEMALADLRAEFDQLMGEEMDEPYHDEADYEASDDEGELDFDAEAPDEEGYYQESMSEATKLQSEVVEPSMKQEGGYAGTGKDTPKAAGNKNSMKAPDRKDYGGNAVKYSTSDMKQGKSVDSEAKAKSNSSEDNIDVANKDNSESLDAEGKYAGTGKNSKSGSVNSKSLF